MFKKERIIFLEALTAILSILYPFWLLIPLVGIRRLFTNDRPFSQRIRRGLADTFFIWVVWAIFWGFIVYQARQPILILPQHINQLTFFGLGGISGTFTLAWVFYNWRKRHIRLSRIKKLEDMKALTPNAFEALIAQLFSVNGHQVELTGGQSDHGIDIVVTNAQSERWIVQCKRYSGSVGEPVVRDLYGTMLHEEAQGAYLMTTGTFTNRAQDWAVGKPIILYDGEALVELIKQSQSKR